MTTAIMTAEPTTTTRIRKATKPATAKPAKRTRKAKVEAIVEDMPTTGYIPSVAASVPPPWMGVTPPWIGVDEFAVPAVAESAPVAEPATDGPIILDHTNFNFSVHDGMITIANPATGSHRTFRIETQADDAKFAPGKRIVSLLTGPDRSDWGNWQSFAFVDDFGVKVWRKHEGSVYETYANMIENPIKWNAKGCEYMAEIACRRCGRSLSNPESILTGYGPTCIQKV